MIRGRRLNARLLFQNVAFSAYFSSKSIIHRDNKSISNLTRTGRIKEARALFDQMVHKHTVSYNAMISGYVKQWEVASARKLFDEMPQRDVVSWNLMISGYVSCGGNGFLKEERYLFDTMPERDCVSWNTMISGYAKNGRMDEALVLFNLMPERNVVSWNAMVAGFLQNGEVARAVEFFERMPERDMTSIRELVSGLIRNERLDEAERVLLLPRGSKENLVLAYNTLIGAYGHRGKVGEARKLFDQIPFYNNSKGKEINGRFERDVVSWNTMIMCYVKAGDIVSARELFDQMMERDAFSWNTIIGGYVNVLDMEEASKLFGKMPNPDTVSWNTMIAGYAQIADLERVKYFFETMPQKNLVSWNSVIAGYEKNEDYGGAINTFIEMQGEGEKPDRHTLSSVLSVAGGIADLCLGMQIHQLVTKTVIPDVPINNALITMHARCGEIIVARRIFDEMKLKKEVISWNAMIGGYASNGYAAEALKLFKLMKSFKVQPTCITFTSVLHACAHTGLVEEGRGIFKSMANEYGIEPRVEHYASMVDIVGRHGQLEEAMDLIKSMPFQPNKVVWSALLAASRVHNNIDMARAAAESLIRLEPESSAPYILLYNMYADVGQWDNAEKWDKILSKASSSDWSLLYNRDLEKGYQGNRSFFIDLKKHTSISADHKTSKRSMALDEETRFKAVLRNRALEARAIEFQAKKTLPKDYERTSVLKSVPSLSKAGILEKASLVRDRVGEKCMSGLTNRWAKLVGAGVVVAAFMRPGLKKAQRS